MSISESVRTMARDGLAVAEIARRLGIRYQHAYNVLKAGGAPSTTSAGGNRMTAERPPDVVVPSKPPLLVEDLVAGGFVFSGRWVLSSAGDLALDRPIPKDIGVYAFAKGGVALYVGVATMGLAKRLYFYGKPGIKQLTNRRLNGIIKAELLQELSIDIYTAMPPNLEWNGLPIHGSAGLELGLIAKFSLPWNKRSAGQAG